MANSAPETDDPLLAHAQARVGSVLQKRWTLVKLLGLGGAAAVYEARHRNGNRAAVKVLHALHSGDDPMRERFLREGYVANKVAHPGVVSVLDDGVDETGSAFLVMDLLDGMSLEAYRERAGGSLGAAEALAFIAAALDVLVAAHGAGIVHRDLKPENFFRTTNGELKVLDFGIARLREHASSATATSSGMLMGTPAFMPPEQASGRWNDVDARSDIWAIGATLLVLTTGLYAHDGGTPMEILAKTIMYPVEPTSRRAPGVPIVVAEIIDHALAFDKERRYASAASMLEAVRAAQAELVATGGGSNNSQHVWPGVVPRGTPGRTEIAVVSSNALRPGEAGTTGAEHRSQPKRSALNVIGVVLVGLLGVGSLVGLGLAGSFRKHTADATLSAAKDVAATATASTAEAPVAAPTELPKVAPAPSERVVDDAPTASASPSASSSEVKIPLPPSSAVTTSPAPAHSAHRPPATPSAQPTPGVGPLTEHL